MRKRAPCNGCWMRASLKMATNERKIVINIDTDVILPDNQPWPPQPGQETGMVTDYKRKRLWVLS